MIAFFCARLQDFPSQSVRKQTQIPLSIFSAFSRKPKASIKGLAAILASHDIKRIPDSLTVIQSICQSLFFEVQIHSFPQLTRLEFISILKNLIEKYPEEIRSTARDYMVGLLQAIEREKDPRNIMLAFKVATTTMRVLQPDVIEQYAEDLFEVCSVYFPIQFRKTSKDPRDISTEHLESALDHLLASSVFFAPFLFSLVEEKLGTPDRSTKKKIFSTLIFCLQRYEPKNSLSGSIETLWPIIRSEVFHEDEEIAADAFLSLQEIVKSLSPELLLSVNNDAESQSGEPLFLFLQPLLSESIHHLRSREDEDAAQRSLDIIKALVRINTQVLDSVARILLDSLLSLSIDRWISVGKQNISLQALSETLLAAVSCFDRGEYSHIRQTFSLRQSQLHDLFSSLFFDPALSFSDRCASLSSLSSLLILHQIESDQDQPLALDEPDTNFLKALFDQALVAGVPGYPRELRRKAFSAISMLAKHRRFADEILATLLPKAFDVISHLSDQQIFEIPSCQPDLSLSLEEPSKVNEALVNVKENAIRVLIGISQLDGCCFQFTFDRLIELLSDDIPCPFSHKQLVLSLNSSAVFSQLQDINDEKFCHLFDSLLGFFTRRSRYLSLVECHPPPPTSAFSEFVVLLRNMVSFFSKGDINESPKTLVILDYLLSQSQESQQFSDLSADDYGISLSQIHLAIVSSLPCNHTDSTKTVIKAVLEKYYFLTLSASAHPLLLFENLCKSVGSLINKYYALASAEILSEPPLEQPRQAIFNGWISKALILANQPAGWKKVSQLINDLAVVVESGSPNPAVNALSIVFTLNHQDCLNASQHAIIRKLYRQRLLVEAIQRLVDGYGSAVDSAVKTNFLQVMAFVLQDSPSLENMKEQLPHILKMVFACLQSEEDQPALQLSAYLIVQQLIISDPEKISEHGATVVSRALSTVTNSKSAKCRVASLQCLAALASLPHSAIHPFKKQVLLHLKSGLDDKKRVVRHAAIFTRNKWFSA